MAVEVVEFLKSKFICDLEEINKDQVALPLRSHFQEIVKILERKTVGSSSSPYLVVEMRNLLYSLNDVFMECQMKSEEHREHKKGPFTKVSLAEVLFRHNSKKQLILIKKKLKDIKDVGASTSSPDPVVARASSFDNESEIHGSETEVEKIEKLLLQRRNEDGFSATAIVGMSGTGKTALAHQVFNSPRVQAEFNPTIWCPVPQTLGKNEDVRAEIVEYILEYLGEFLTGEHDLNKLLQTLYRKLIGKRYLIVLDDIWHIDDEWYNDLDLQRKNEDWGKRLAYGLPKGDGGGIIVTSRHEEVAKEMVGGTNLHHIQPLTDESCWLIFMNAIEKGKLELDHPILEEMKVEIVEKCNGFPLAAKTLGVILSKQIKEENKANATKIT